MFLYKPRWKVFVSLFQATDSSLTDETVDVPIKALDLFSYNTVRETIL